MYALIDANSYYCSAEQVFRPDWRGKPIIVLSNNDGMIVAANRQARELGIPKFQPYFKIKGLCEAKGVIALSSNYELYSDLSQKMMQVIGRFAPDSHVYSIDEAFLRLDNFEKIIPDLAYYGYQIRKAVWKECRLPVCVGIGKTITLAKIANHAAKKIQGWNGVCVISNNEIRIAVLKQLDVQDVWGIGRQLSKKLRLMDINNAYDLSCYSPERARREFSIEVERTVRELNGLACISWDVAKADKKQIYSTRTMGSKVTDIDTLQQALSKHAGIASAKARQQGSLCKVMTCFASSSAYDDNAVSFKFVHHFEYPTNDATVITQAVSNIAKKLFKKGILYHKVGVGLIDLISENQQQMDWLNPLPDNPQLMTVYDGINEKYGMNTMFLAAQGIDQQWAMKRSLLTPQYTTKWRDLPEVNCR